MAVHHPFTSPNLDDAQYLESDPGRIRARAYDIVYNGVEIGGGSIRIHDQELQSRAFQAIGIDRDPGFGARSYRYASGRLQINSRRNCLSEDAIRGLFDDAGTIGGIR